MGKIVMPKNSALLNEIEPVLEIYYHADGWMQNEEYKIKLKSMIGDDQYSSSYTKKAQITSYFGFTEWEDISNPRSRRRITDSGRTMYEALKNDDTKTVQDILMTALETVKFGRDNFGCPESDSDVEPPALYIRAILDLGYLTYREFAFLLWKLEDVGANYTDALKELRILRSKGSVDIGEEANKYIDCKPIMILVRWGFLAEDDSSSEGGKHIVIEPSVFERFEPRLRNLKIYNIDMNIGAALKRSSDVKTESIGGNIILYGVPGSGKSHTIKTKYCDNDQLKERTVFHPDYTYSDFVGQIIPKITQDKNWEKKVTYEFEPGPFTRILNKAVSDPDNHYYLIIEEINRGNAPAIFGDIFQLLDRNENGASEYGISNADVAEKVYKNKDAEVKIPSNLTLLATMNTSDQNVFTLDTAFKRRWTMQHIKNNIDGCEFGDERICDTDITWAAFAKTINETIIEFSTENFSNEDNRLGAYFVKKDELTDADKFGEKVLMYLWNDAFKYNHDRVFRPKYHTLDELIDGFKSVQFDVFLNKERFDKYKKSDASNDEFTDKKNTDKSIDEFLNNKPSVFLNAYNNLLERIKALIPDIRESTPASKPYAKWTTDKIITRVAFVNIYYEGGHMIIYTMPPRQNNTIGVMVEQEKWSDYCFKYKVLYSEEAIDEIIEIIVDSYEQLVTE